MQKLVLTFFYSGCVKIAPGTFGTLAALIPAFFILKYLSVQSLFLLSFLIFLVGMKAVNKYEQEGGEHDNKHIVIDEVAGVFLACALSASASNSLFNFILAFVLFRFFDITKPSLIGKIDKKVKGGLGVMLDDMLAGLLGAIIYGLGMKFELLTFDLLLENLF